MSTYSSVSISHHRNPVEAGNEVVSNIQQELNGQTPDIIFLFATVGYDQQILLSTIQEYSKDIIICGCSGEGVIGLGEADESNFCVGLMAIASTDLKFSPLHLDETECSDMPRMGSALAEKINNTNIENPLGVFIFADPFSFNFDPFVSNFEKTLNQSDYLPLLGTLAGENFQFEKTYQYCNNKIYNQGLSAVLISGDAEMIYQVNHGSIPIGKARTITKSIKNKIYELDGIPILKVFEEYVPKEVIQRWDEMAISLCLGFETSNSAGNSDIIIRALQQKNEDEGYVMLSTEKELKVGSKVWMTHRDHNLVFKGVEDMIKKIKIDLNGREPIFIFDFDCSGRGKILFNQSQKKQLKTRLQDSFGKETPLLGLYVYGEICPINKQSCFHNYTNVIVAFTPKK